MTPEHLKAAGIFPTLADDIAENRDIRTRELKPLIDLGKILNVAPFELSMKSI